MRTTIELPDEILKKAKIRAVEEGVSLKQLFTRALERELGIGSKSEPAEPPKPKVDTSFRNSLKTGNLGGVKPAKSGFSGFKIKKP